jgi:hypothetical protein
MQDVRRGINIRKSLTLVSTDIRVPTAKALDLFRPAYDIQQQPIPLVNQKPYTARINITFRFYRPGKLFFTLGRD